MSKKRHRGGWGDDDGVLVRNYAVTHPPNLDIPSRRFGDWDQLAYASSGVMNVDAARGTWVVPPHRAVWIPAGVDHEIRMTGRVAVRTLFLHRTITCDRVPPVARALNVSPLLRELVLHTSRVGILHRHVPAHVRLAEVILDQLETLPTVPLRLPMPTDPRARLAAETLMRDPGAPDAISEATRAAGAARRTLERLFAAETQMTLGRWHQRARLIEALRLLAGEHAVTEVALAVGYNNPSAFIAAFKRQLGTTPGRYFDA